MSRRGGAVVMWRMGGKSVRPLAAAAAVAIVVIAAPAGAATEAVISAVRAERRGANVLDLHFATRGAPQMHLSAHGNQLWIDFERTKLEIPSLLAESAPLKSLRAIKEPDGRSRLIVEVTGKTDYAVARIPGEIVVRLAPAGSVPDLAASLASESMRPARSHEAAPRAAATPLTPASPSAAERVLGHALVVIDPGHGGRDPGARDSSGELVEKDLALRISHFLARALEARGVSVEMTRQSDTFFRLPERTRFANRDNADLFVSVHLNSSPNTATNGIEVYYLNNTTDRAGLRLARMENGDGYGAPSEPNLNYILSDLRQNDKAAESASLSRMIEAQTVTELDDAFRLGVKPLGAKMGPFYVLVGARMPAVLVECGFLSNPLEAERLAGTAYQQRLADGIASAVVGYLNADLASGNL